jgi:hypothetical protein
MGQGKQAGTDRKVYLGQEFGKMLGAPFRGDVARPGKQQNSQDISGTVLTSFHWVLFQAR